jgi:hypothetical protein
LSYLSRSLDTPPSTPVKTSLNKPISADISPAKRASLAMLGKASPQAASALSLSEKLRAAKKQKKAQQKLLPTVAVTPEENKEKNVLIRTLSTVADSMFARAGRSDDTEPKDEPKNGTKWTQQNLPLGNSGGWGAEDDEWEED